MTKVIRRDCVALQERAMCTFTYNLKTFGEEHWKTKLAYGDLARHTDALKRPLDSRDAALRTKAIRATQLRHA